MAFCGRSLQQIWMIFSALRKEGLYRQDSFLYFAPYQQQTGKSAINGGMMKKLLAVFAVVFAVTVIGGCGGGNVPVKIINDLGAWNIEEVKIDLSDQPWGENRISETIEAGEDVIISVPAGTYDIMIVDEDGDSYTRWEVAIGADGYEWAVTLADID